MNLEDDFTVLKKFKYLVNAEYLKNMLEDNKIESQINYENNTLSVKIADLKIAKIIVEKQQFDETDTIDQENFLDGLDEWNNNNLNPGHYLGGNLPFFYKTKANHMTFAILSYLSFALQIGLLFYTTNYSLWNFFFLIITLIIAVNFMISGFDYKEEFKIKKNKIC